MRADTFGAAALVLVLVAACHDGEPRGLRDSDPIVGSWQVLNLNSSAHVAFQASGTFVDPGSLLFSGFPYAWRRENPDHISVLSRFDAVLDVHAVLTDDLRGLSLEWTTGSAKLARLESSDGAGPVLPAGSGGTPSGAAPRDGSSP